MYRPNNTCTLRAVMLDQNGEQVFDIHGRPTYMADKMIPCAVISLDLAMDKTSVRADSSASRGKAMEIGGDAMILVGPNQTTFEGDYIKAENRWFEVIAIFPRRSVYGRLDHNELVLRKAVI